MPVRSLNSSVFRWPDRQAVDRAVREWAQRMGAARPEVLRIGYFGSYARGDWGVGSDLDVVVIAERAAERFELRAVDWGAFELPVPADVLVYTPEELRRLPSERFRTMIETETVWVYQREGLPEEPERQQRGAGESVISS